MPNIGTHALSYIVQNIKKARADGNMPLVDKLLDLLNEYSEMADDTDALAWGFHPYEWAPADDLIAMNSKPFPTTERLRR